MIKITYGCILLYNYDSIDGVLNRQVVMTSDVPIDGWEVVHVTYPAVYDKYVYSFPLSRIWAD